MSEHLVTTKTDGLVMDRKRLVARLEENLASAKELLKIVEDKSDTRTLTIGSADCLRKDIVLLEFFVDYFGSAIDENVKVSDAIFASYVHCKWLPEHAIEQDVLEKRLEKLKAAGEKLKEDLKEQSVEYTPPTVTPWWRFWE